CDICKKRIEKAAYSVKGVKSAKWDANLGSIFMIIDESKCSVPDIAKAVAGVGHDTELAKAKDEAYNNLHSCCQYKRVK
ncbi:MAG TPA: metal transporter, partial [Flavobacterium sp.]|nr:metal transporter [Flavobacterium sp.]